MTDPIGGQDGLAAQDHGAQPTAVGSAPRRHELPVERGGRVENGDRLVDDPLPEVTVGIVLVEGEDPQLGARDHHGVDVQNCGIEAE